MKNKKILRVIIALLSVFVIAVGIYIIIGQPENDTVTAENEQGTSANEEPVSKKPMTSARDERDINEEVNSNELSPDGYDSFNDLIFDVIYDYDYDYDDSYSPKGLVIMHSPLSEIEDDIDNYYPDNKPFSYEFFIQYQEEGTSYFEEILAEDSLRNETESYDQNVDLVILEPSWAYDLINSDYIMPLSELGFTEEELADQFPFTVSLTSDDNGVQKGLMYKLNPEVFIYRKSIAKEVLGTDDPATVAEYVKDRETFEATAEKMKEHGYKMLESTTDESMMFTQYDTKPIAFENGDCIIPESWRNWAEHTKSYSDKGYVVNTPRYSDEWLEGRESIESNEFFAIVYGAIYAEDFVNDYPDFAICPGPVGSYDDVSYFGTSYIICATKFTDDPEICADIMRTLALDKETLKSMALSDNVLTNTVSGMTEIAEGEYDGNSVGGYNPFYVYIEAAKKIGDVKSNNSPYDMVLDYYIEHMDSYFQGTKSYDECVTDFQNNLKQRWYYPE
jgi:hypothetical protein